MKTLPWALLALCLCCLTAVRADDDATKAEASETNSKSPLHTLRYRFAEGETVRSKVVHLVTVETRIQGTTQTAKTRSVATKVWDIKSVGDDGQVTFVHSVADVDMWQSVSGRQVIRYDSRKDEKAPPGYEHVAESIGVPLATVTIDSAGRVLKREDNRPQFNPGIGDLTVPLPEEPVAVGHRWTVPDEVQLRLPGEPIRRIKTRQVYTLRKVKTGVATIDVRTEVLTPVQDPAIEAQLVQRLQDGTIKFDLDAGRLLSRQMDMDKTVIGFNGAESQMEYLARFTEERLSASASGEATEENPAKTDSEADDQDEAKVAGPRRPTPATAAKPDEAADRKR